MHLHHLSSKVDIICLQEHWLFSYENHRLEEAIPGFSCLAKSVDDDSPLPPHYRPSRGKGGAAILWSSKLDDIVEPTQDGSDRTCVILLESTPPVCIINTYMPTTGPEHNVRYMEMLGEVSELIYKYSKRYNVIWAGDLNASFVRNKPTSRDNIFSTFCLDIGLNPTHMDPDTQTFHHSSGSTSQIDYIRQLSWQQAIISDIVVEERSHLNTSPHDPVIANLNIRLQRPKPSQIKSTNQTIRPTSKLTDLVMYRDETKDKLTILLASCHDLPVDVILDRIHSILLVTATENTRARKPPHRRNSWTPAISAKCKLSKVAHQAWKLDGGSKTSLSYLNMKEARKAYVLNKERLQLKPELKTFKT